MRLIYPKTTPTPTESRAKLTKCDRRRGPALRRYGWLIALVLLTVGACAPRVQHAGQTIGAPQLGDDTITASDGYILPLRVWAAAERPRAVILALHGFNDYSNAFDAPASWWAKSGITTYAYDQRGFGSSANRRIWPATTLLHQDLREVAQVITSRHPDTPVFILGVSMGGAVVMSAEARRRQDENQPGMPAIAGQILVGPAVWGRVTMPMAYRIALWFGVHTMPGNRVTGRGLGIVPSDNIEMLRALGRDPLVIKETRVDALYGLVNLMDDALAAAPHLTTPSLVLYGARDEIIPRAPTIRMLEAFGAPHRIVLYSNGYHMLLRDLQAEVVWRDIAAWIDNAAAPLPSGSEIDRPELFAQHLVDERLVDE